MSRRPARGAFVAGALALLLAVAGCGVPLQESAQPVDGIATATAPPAPATTGRMIEYWFVADDVLVGERDRSPTPVTVAEVLKRLAAGPVELEGTARSLVADPVGGALLVSAADPAEVVAQGEPVTVRLAPSFGALPPTEQPLLLGQVVLTLTGVGASAVAFTDPEGSPVSVPAPDGRVLEGPATRSAYVSLQRPSSALAQQLHSSASPTAQRS